jgi:predicted MarR family transcription regulator
MASQSSSFGAYLDTYDRLTSVKKQAPGDAAASLLKRVMDRQEISLADLVSTSGMDVHDLDVAIAKLVKLDAVELTGSGLQQKLRVTPKAADILDLFR